MATTVITVVTPAAVDVTGVTVQEKLAKLAAVLVGFVQGPLAGTLPSVNGPVTRQAQDAFNNADPSTPLAGGTVSVTLS